MKARICGTVAALALLGFGVAPAYAQLAPALQYAWSQNLAAYNRKNVDETMRTIDSRSPDYETTKQAIEDQFKDLDVTASLVSFDYMGHDKEFAVARVKTKTTGKPGSGFADNVTDTIVLFHQENGTWKVWSEEILGVDILP